ncbi:MAG TPA: glycosyltransferase [Gaiellales bacterium]|jgi:glycosyltransferase involved in cell wall biosynthesis|nr:glycosyltransferase [Gaiellales bacterium]
MNADVTVIIPAWDLGEELAEAVSSVDPGSLAVRTLVVDNASTARLQTGNAEVIRLSERVTVGEARNVGLEAADSPYVMFLDGDDQLAPGAIEHLHGLLEGSPDAAIALCRATAWNRERGEPVKRQPFPPAWADRLARHRTGFAATNAVRNIMPVTGSVLIRTSVARDAGGFAASNFAQDWALGVGVAFRGRVLLSWRDGGRYSISDDSISARRRRPQVMAVRREIRSRLRRDPAVPAAVKLLLPAIAAAQWITGWRRMRYRRPLGAAGARRPLDS